MKATKVFFFLLLMLCGSSKGISQEFYIYVQGNDLLQYNPQNCTTQFVQSFSQSFTDIALHRNGNLYGIRSFGEVYEMDMATGTETFVRDLIHEADLYSSMTSGADGNLYIGGRDGDLVLYNPDTDVENYIGSIPQTIEGDLTFREGILYAGSTNSIVRINLENPSLSTVESWFTSSKPIWGIITDFIDCDTQFTYAMSGNSTPSTIWELDIENQSFTELCDLPENIYGATTEDEFRASSPINIEVEVTDADCGATNGSIEITEITGDNLVYSLATVTDGSIAEVEALQLSAGDYDLIVTDEYDCEEVYSFTVNELSSTISVTVEEFDRESCDTEFGSIEITVIEGTNLSFTIDGIVSNTTETEIAEIPPGDYTLQAIDENGCSANVPFEIEDNCDPQEPEEPEEPVDPELEGDLITTPMAFSPNLDGSNDVFKVLAPFEITIVNYQIFDRWGNLIFENGNFSSSNESAYWQGRLPTGEIQAGSFLYNIQYETNDDTGNLAGVAYVLW